MYDIADLKSPVGALAFNFWLNMMSLGGMSDFNKEEGYPETFSLIRMTDGKYRASFCDRNIFDDMMASIREVKKPIKYISSESFHLQDCLEKLYLEYIKTTKLMDTWSGFVEIAIYGRLLGIEEKIDRNGARFKYDPRLMAVDAGNAKEFTGTDKEYWKIFYEELDKEITR